MKHFKQSDEQRQRGISDKLGLDLTRTVARSILDVEPLEDLSTSIKKFIITTGDLLPHDQYDEITENVWVHVSACIPSTAKITPPSIICGGAIIGHFSHVKCSVVGAFATIGDHSTVDHCIIFDKATLRGRNSLCRSIIGYRTELEYGVIAPRRATLASNRPHKDTKVPFSGAIICDEVFIGAGSVIEPDAVVNFCSSIPSMTKISGYFRPYFGVK